MSTEVSRPLVVITGASSGIGAATASEFAAAGHPLLLMARRVDRCQALGLRETICAGVDVTDRDSAAQALERAVAAYGAPDLLVNNAGVMPLGRIDDQNPLEWRRLFDVNCLGLLNLTQLVLPHMLAAGRGTIVNVGSVAGRNLYPDHTVYCGTKFAVHAMTEQMRKELADRNIRVCVIAPGMVETELLDGTTSDHIKANYTAYKNEIGGAIDPADVARSISVIYGMDQRVCVRELVIAPTGQDA